VRIGMTSLTLRNQCVEDVIKVARAAGVEGIEWGVSDEHLPLCDCVQAEKIKTLSKKYGVKIFSLGSYCGMNDKEMCDKTLETAVMLGAPVIRVWAGEQSPKDCDEDYINLIVSNTVYMAKKAEKYNISLGFEYHQNTLTETAESAVALVKKVNMKNVGLYWQPLWMSTTEENLSARTKVLPYLIGNLHIHNYSPEKGYQPLSDIMGDLHLYYDDIKEKDYNVMIEFVKDSDFENLKDDASVLKGVLS